MPITDDGRCTRCHEPFIPMRHMPGQKCSECGVDSERPVLSRNSSRRRHKIGGKRGHNSGKVSSKGKKKGA